MKIGLSFPPAPGPVNRAWSETRDLLFEQRDLVLDVEVSSDSWCSRIRLASSDADGVIPGGNDGTAKLRDHAQIAVLKLEVNLLACARFEMDALKSTKSDLRRTPSHQGT